jgi:serine/threonine protein phosphatase PrpC
MRYLAGNAQHIGARHSQQDSFGFADPEDREFTAHGGFLAIVCDGMGGMEYGDAASRTAVRSFMDAYRRKTPQESIPQALERSVREANDGVLSLAASLGLVEGIGTTLIAVALHEHSLYFVSVGDSGLFHVNEQGIRMLNRPHIFANLLDAAVARGAMSADDAANHPERESLTSFIGAKRLEEIDLNTDPFPLADGEAVLLASDGLFKTLELDEMLACCTGPPQGWPDALVTRTIAKKREYQDNVTVLCVAEESVKTPGLPPTTPRAASGQSDGADLPRTVRMSPPPAAGLMTPMPAAPAWAPPVQAQPAPAEKKKSSLLLPLAVLVLIVAGAAAWWYATQHRAGVHPMTGPKGGSVETPHREPMPAPPAIDPKDVQPPPRKEP